MKQVKELRPDASREEILELAHARAKVLQAAIQEDLEKNRKEEHERAVKKAKQEAEAKRERMREKEW